MNSENKRKFNANIKAINRDLMELSEDKMPNDELIKMQFEAIRTLVDDCEKLALNSK